MTETYTGACLAHPGKRGRAVPVPLDAYGHCPLCRVRDPRTESIFRAVRAGSPAVSTEDPGAFLVEYWPHLYGSEPVARVVARAWGIDVCSWCPFPRLHPVHPAERAA